MTEYVIRVRPTTDGYRATLVEHAARTRPLDVCHLPTGAASVGAAATAPAAILAAVVAARIPAIPNLKGPSYA